MGIWDVFTGDPAKKAAEENKQLYLQNQQQGWGFLDTGLGQSKGAIDAGIAGFAPLSALGAKYGGATNLLLDAQGVNGPEGVARAKAAFQTGPGYDFQLTQGTDAINRRRAAGGMLNSGNADIDALKFGQGLANQEWGNWQNRLASFAPLEASTTAGAASGTGTLQALLAQLYGRNAEDKTNLGTTTTSGLAKSNTDAASAEMAGSGNLWGLGLNLAKLFAGGK